jgi:D-glycero-D-manno-heptose 1,7-bisphosphate phosphatase
VFLDRDGVVNIDKGYVSRWEDFEFLPGAVEAMRRFAQAGYLLIVVTNQSGLARGLYSQEQYDELSSRFTEYLARNGVNLTGIYHCPHHPDGSVKELSVTCECRKPAPGMLLQARTDHGLDMAQSILVGDKVSDIEAGRAAGVGRLFFVATKHGRGAPPIANEIVGSLYECADRLSLE